VGPGGAIRIANNLSDWVRTGKPFSAAAAVPRTRPATVTVMKNVTDDRGGFEADGADNHSGPEDDAPLRSLTRTFPEIGASRAPAWIPIRNAG